MCQSRNKVIDEKVQELMEILDGLKATVLKVAIQEPDWLDVMLEELRKY